MNIISLLAISSLVTNPMVDDREEKLWKANITPLLAAPLWSSPARAYSAGHVLMVPLHAAFSENNAGWKKELSDQFKRYLAEGKDEFKDWGNPPRLNFMQYLYLHTRFCTLAAQSGDTNLIPEGMAEWLSDLLARLWTKENSITYGHAPFEGMRDRLLYKLDLKNPAKTYYRAIIDEERYLFAEAADLRAYEQKTKKALPNSKVLTEILDTAEKVFSTRGSDQPGGGWLFEPGIWTDHPDYVFAGQSTKSPGISQSPRPGIGEDTSHSHRLPLWLTSLAEAYPPGSETRKLYESLRERTENQFFNRVLVKPTSDFPGYRTTNFMDGTNGVYRYNYKALGAGNGYDAYELSGTFSLGWWTFLGSERIRKVYAEQASKFPMPANVVRTYLGGSGTDKVDDAVAKPQKFNDLRELLCRLAAKTSG